MEDNLFPPRKVPTGTTGKLVKASVLRLLLGGIWFMVGAVLLVGFALISNPLHDYWLSRSGQVVRGRVTDVAVESGRRVDGRNPYVVRYTFEANGRRWNGWSFTSSEELVRGLDNESRVEVEYIAAKPAINRARGTRASLFPALLFLVPLSFVMAGGWVILWGVSKVFRLRNLLVNGHVAVGTVTGKRTNKLINVGQRHPVDVSYLFEDLRGTEWSGRTRVYFPPAGVEVPAAEQVRVVYNSLNPTANFAYELYGIDLSGGG